MTPKPVSSSSGDRRFVTGGDPWLYAGVAFCVLMFVLHVAAGLNSPGLLDSWRDFYWATVIAHGEAFPLFGPQINQMAELGPWWFYLLALPIRLGANAAVTMAFVQALAALKYPLALRLGTRIGDTRFGVACAISLAVAGWSSAGLIFPSHIALVETTVLLLVFATWRWWSTDSTFNALLYGLASAACVHAHPTTLTFVAGSGVFLLWHRRSWRTFGLLCVAASIVVLSVVPLWLHPDATRHDALKPLSQYVAQEIGVHPWVRIPSVLYGIVAIGAWWGLLLMTPLKLAAARVAWWFYCGSVLTAVAGYALLPADARRLRTIGAWAVVAFVLQVSITVILRPVTPVWMISACLPPLALAIAVGWQGWFASVRPGRRLLGIAAAAVFVVCGLAPSWLSLHDLHAARVMPGVNPFMNAGEHADEFAVTPVAFYPVRRVDRLAPLLCEPTVLHGRLAAVMEATLGAPVRNACGHWADVRYGGVEGDGRHLTGLFTRAARAAGIEPDRIVARMALYDHAVPIAPMSGNRDAPLRRFQVGPDGAPGDVRSSQFEFDADAQDVVVLTNRFPMLAPMYAAVVTADTRAATNRYDDGGSVVYACADCGTARRVHWRMEVHGIAGNLDLVVLPHAARPGP